MAQSLEGVIIKGDKAQYRMVKELSSGAQAKVYEGLDLSRNKRVAIKILSGTDSGAYERAEREAKIFHTLKPNNIMYMHDNGKYDDQGVIRFFCVFPLIPGGITLEDVIANEGSIKPLSRALNLLSQIANGLKEAHACGVVHRDIKPGNILVHTDEGGRETAYIMDFGIAAVGNDLAEAFEQKLTLDNHILGTPHYAAPEQLDDKSEHKRDFRVDVYAFGVTAFEVLSGRTPFSAFQGSDMLRFICEKRDGTLFPDSLGKYGKDLPADLVLLIDACLQGKPSERPEAHEVLEKLNVIKLDLPSSTSTPPASRKIRTPGSTNVSVDAETMIAPSDPPAARTSMQVDVGVPPLPKTMINLDAKPEDQAPRQSRPSPVLALSILALAIIVVLGVALTQTVKEKPVFMDMPSASASAAPMPPRTPPVASSVPAASKVAEKAPAQPSTSAKPKAKAKSYAAPPPVDWAPPSGMPMDPSMPVPPM